MIFFYAAIFAFCVVLGIILYALRDLGTETHHVKLYLNVLIENQARAIENEERIALILEEMINGPSHAPSEREPAQV